MKRLNSIFGLFLLLSLGNAVGLSAATIDPYTGHWRVDWEQTMENFRRFAPQHLPEGGFPPAIIRSIKKMLLQISKNRYVFKAGKRKIINSKFEIISLSDEGVMMRIYIGEKVREQLLVLSPQKDLQIIAMNNGKPEHRASANYFIWHRKR